MDDIISRQEATQTALDFIVEYLGGAFDEDFQRKLIERMNDLPSAEPVRMKGKWIYGESEEGNDGYFCDQCGNFVPWIYKEFDIDFIKEVHFCPSCGADMRGEEDE